MVVNLEQTRFNLSAALQPQPWIPKEENPEDSLASLEKFLTRYKHWAKITKSDRMDPDERWSTLIAIGGEKIEDLIIHMAKVVIEDVPAVVANANLGRQAPSSQIRGRQGSRK